MTAISRRTFVVASTAAGFSLGFRLPAAAAPATAVPEVNAWVVVHPNDQVVIRIARSEMGQGTLTGLAQLVAEELACDWSRVTTEYPSPAENAARNRVWGSFMTGGSRGIRDSHDLVRKGGAAARMMLIEAAARQWGVPASECAARASVIRHPPSGRSTTYGAVAARAATLTPPTAITLKDPKDWTIAGQPLKRLDTRDKLTGAQVYGIDLRLPGMLHAAVKACPVFGGTVKSFDASAVASLKGVRRVAQIGDDTVAVVADSWWQAKTALDALPVVWNEGDNAAVSSATIARRLEEGLRAADAVVGNERGDARGVLDKAARVIEGVYSYPFQNHATMEPMNATALFTGERCEVWCPTQNGEEALAETAAAAGLPASQCDVHKVHLGGGFGRRSLRQANIAQAVALAKAMPGTPIKVVWSREEDMAQGQYHPTTQCRMRAALDERGELAALHMRVSGPSILASLLPQAMRNGRDPGVFQGLNPSGDSVFGYGVANLLIDHAMRNTHVPLGFWRGVNINHNAIYLECFIDEIAHASGHDPLALRRKLLAGAPKALAVLNAAAARAGWDTPAPQGVHRGIAQIMAFGSYVAAVAEISLAAGKLRVERLTAAIDPGTVVNPAQVERQIAGSFAYGLSALFYGECTVDNGRMAQQNFDSYPILRMAEMPRVESVLVPSGGFFGGVGEPTIAVAAPSVLNAIFAATGRRIRSFPLTKHGFGQV